MFGSLSSPAYYFAANFKSSQTHAPLRSMPVPLSTVNSICAWLWLTFFGLESSSPPVARGTYHAANSQHLLSKCKLIRAREFCFQMYRSFNINSCTQMVISPRQNHSGYRHRRQKPRTSAPRNILGKYCQHFGKAWNIDVTRWITSLTMSNSSKIFRPVRLDFAFVLVLLHHPSPFASMARPANSPLPSSSPQRPTTRARSVAFENDAKLPRTLWLCYIHI